MLSRRNLLKLAAATQMTTLLPDAVQAGETLSLGPPEAFNFDILKQHAKTLAAQDYVPPPMPDPATVETMNYDVAKSIKFNEAHALFGGGAGAYPVTFLTVGKTFAKSVRLYALADGAAREVLFRPEYFTFPSGGPLGRLATSPSPFAGFELRQAHDQPARREHEGWARFIGASYFRGVGEADQFGLSARGLAQNSGVANPEEFPDFTHFWIGQGAHDEDAVEVYALLDGPSVAGAYRFILHRDRATTMDITCELHLRRPIERIGIGPMTSMYWYSQMVKGAGVDWRPAIHDSDGVALWTGTGEHIWRPLNNPRDVNISTFEDENPRGFGLMQRDKTYDHYLDAVFYERRPCGWVQPRGEWGKGSVQLVEIPTDNEIYDNIIVMWVPAEPTYAGQTLTYRYDLLWRDIGPFPGDLALCVATFLGKGAVQGAPRSQVLRKFMVEFKGAPFLALKEGEVPDSVLTASRGTFSNVITEPSPDGDRSLWRVQFDLDPVGSDAIEMRCFMRHDGRALTETWAYRHIPFESPVR